MEARSFSTIGREYYPGYELKICCDKDTDYLDGNDLEDRFRIVYIKEGYAVFRNGDISQLVTSPAVLCLNEKDEVELCNSVGLKMDIMYFEPSCFELYITFVNLEVWKSQLDNDNWFFRPFFQRSKSFIGACATNQYVGNRITYLINRTDRELHIQSEFWPCRSRSYFIELLLLTNSIYDENNELETIYFGKMTDEIKDMISWLHGHYLEKITIEMVTKQFNTNKTTLNQKFKAVMGVTVMEYISNLRMQIACSFLRKTYLSINEVMERSGYKDDSHFNRTFRKHIGCTPSDYRNQYVTPE